MDTNAFKRIVTAFADPQTELLFEKDRALIQVNGNLIEISLKQRSGELIVVDNGCESPANKWILTRLAQLPLLADRLISTIPVMNAFITPEADLLQSLEVKPGDESEHWENALDGTLTTLGQRSPLETTVLYITSDAGEGKTWLINEMARRQAERFKAHQSDWLLVPIQLGGRHFLRFDDITVGALQNRYRFPFLHYDSFIELVRLGVLIPAFDGFEEMMVESSSGEALTAMGILVNSLQSCGALVVAARKAYFEFENLKTQERLYDTISGYDVGFGKVGLCRWKKKQFLAYCQARHLPDAEQFYAKVVSRLSADHSLLTRPVLVRRLVDIAEQSRSLDDFLAKLQASGADSFSVFVRGIVEREANEKWVYRSGEEIAKPLLSVEEHCELLSYVALEMWQSRVDFLKPDSLAFVTDYFCETKRKSAAHAAQIRERVRGHALLVPSSNVQGTVEFDHDEFRQFFLGEAIGKMSLSQTNATRSDLLNVLRKGVLPEKTFTSVLQAVGRAGATRQREVVTLLAEIALSDGQTSFTHENCASLVLSLLSGAEGGEVPLRRLSFPPGALRDKKLSRTVFEDCYFGQSSLENTAFQNCRFELCQFAKLEIHASTKISGAVMNDCTVDSLCIVSRATTVYDPVSVGAQLVQLGFTIPAVVAAPPVAPSQPTERDDAVTQFEKLLHSFIRSTHISDHVILKKLGTHGNSFVSQVVPGLLKENVFVEIQHRGGGSQRHFKLGRPMAVLSRALEDCGGSFDRFIEEVKRSNVPTRPTTS